MRSAVVLAGLALAGCAARDVPPAPAPVAAPAQAAAPTTVAAPAPLIFLFKSAPGTMAFTALGTEPFWSIMANGNDLVYSTPELPDGVRLFAGWGYSRDPSGLEGFSFSAKLNGEPLVLEIDSGTCSDGMSDTVYPYTAKLRIGTVNVKGCARRK